MKRFTTLTGTRPANEADFRTPHNTLMLNLEYYEFLVYDRIWVRRITDEDTDRPFLKSKIALGYIHVPLVPVLWDQDPLKVENKLSA